VVPFLTLQSVTFDAILAAWNDVGVTAPGHSNQLLRGRVHFAGDRNASVRLKVAVKSTHFISTRFVQNKDPAGKKKK